MGERGKGEDYSNVTGDEGDKIHFKWRIKPLLLDLYDAKIKKIQLIMTLFCICECVCVCVWSSAAVSARCVCVCVMSSPHTAVCVHVNSTSSLICISASHHVARTTSSVHQRGPKKQADSKHTLSLTRSHTHTHIHTHKYIYVYTYTVICMDHTKRVEAHTYMQLMFL